MWRLVWWSRCLLVFMVVGVPVFAACDEPPAADEGKAAAPARGFPAPQGLQRLAPTYDIWIDKDRKLVVVDGTVVLREGQLEMFACLKGTKEHESIVAVNSNAQFVHAGLLMLGADPGHPVVFAPEYKSAAGPEVEVLVLWRDEQGKQQKVRGQDWVQHIKTKKAMEYPWVFAGSQVMTDETTGKNYYLADGGDFICVSNFTSAMLDLPIASSQDNVDLTFRAFTERIPPVGTPVRLVLRPILKPAKSKEGDPKKSNFRKGKSDAEKGDVGKKDNDGEASSDRK